MLGYKLTVFRTTGARGWSLGNVRMAQVGKVKQMRLKIAPSAKARISSFRLCDPR